MKPRYIRFTNAICPKCGFDFMQPCNTTSGGHLGYDSMLTTNRNSVLGIRHLLFRACTAHYEEAKVVLPKDADHDSLGYQGEWNPELGIMAEVETGEMETIKKVRII